jgi:hypothetical protein
VVLWQMLIGKQLFSGDTVAHILANVINSAVDFSKLPETTPIPIRDSAAAVPGSRREIPPAMDRGGARRDSEVSRRPARWG